MAEITIKLDQREAVASYWLDSGQESPRSGGWYEKVMASRTPTGIGEFWNISLQSGDEPEETLLARALAWLLIRRFDRYSEGFKLSQQTDLTSLASANSHVTVKEIERVREELLKSPETFKSLEQTLKDARKSLPPEITISDVDLGMPSSEDLAEWLGRGPAEPRPPGPRNHL